MVLEVLSQRRREREVLHLVRVASTVIILDTPRQPLLVVQLFAFSEELGRESKCNFQCVGFDACILPDGVESVALHRSSHFGFTIPNPLSGGPLGIYHLSPSIDAESKVVIDNLMEKALFENHEERPTRYFNVELKDADCPMEPGDEWPMEVSSLKDGRLLVSALSSMDVRKLDFE